MKAFEMPFSPYFAFYFLHSAYRYQWCNEVLETWPKLTVLFICLFIYLFMQFPSDLMKLGLDALLLKGVLYQRGTVSWA